jgi:hypothetical protein
LNKVPATIDPIRGRDTHKNRQIRWPNLTNTAGDLKGKAHAATDLQALNPTDDELLKAVAWSRTHDPSEGYLESIKMFFREFGYEHLVE